MKDRRDGIETKLYATLSKSARIEFFCTHTCMRFLYVSHNLFCAVISEGVGDAFCVPAKIKTNL